MNAVLAVLLVVVVAVTVSLRVDHTQPNLEFLPDMKYSPAWSAFDPNPYLPEGRTLQAPVAGTIARGATPLHYLATKEDAVRAGEEIRNPYVSTTVAASPDAKAAEANVQGRLRASTQRGAEVYRTFCTACHGTTGLGDGPVAKRGFPPPPSLLTGKSRQMKDGQLLHILTYGQASMSSFAPQLSRERRWDVINFIREMQSKVPASPEIPKP